MGAINTIVDETMESIIQQVCLKPDQEETEEKDEQSARALNDEV